MENPEQDPNNEVTQKEIKRAKGSFKSLFVSIANIFKETFNIRQGAQIKDTIEGIKRDISFKGHNSWILVFSIFIASIGLNVNSIPVVIGAMLISPLMGPILGLGLAVGTNDWETLTRSLKNYGVMVIIALATSTLYFSITPLNEITSELLNRVKPTLLDVFIAIFGGLAGIVAGSRKEKSNVVSGVAIATALMPPLCTAGYGLASGQGAMFFGAMYLFLLNSVFICMSTYVVIRYLRFPLKEFVDSVKEKKIRYSIAAFVAVVIIPSGFIFYDVIKETIFNRNLNEFLTSEVSYEGAEIINQKVQYEKESQKVDVFFIGERVPDAVVKGWKKKMDSYDLSTTELTVHQSKDETGEIAGKITESVRSGIIQDLYEKKAELLESKDKQISLLEAEIVKLSKRDSVPVNDIFEEGKILFAWIQQIEGGYMKTTKKSGEFPIVLVIPNPAYTEGIDKTAFSKWLRTRLKNPSLEIHFVNEY